MNPIEQFNLKFGYRFDSLRADESSLRLMAELAELRGRKDISRRLLAMAEVNHVATPSVPPCLCGSTPAPI